ncbi:MAG TPA: 3-dehydroquinate synthase [archaeon]|nr:3-dehydroquinate synthase [archaeon]
MKVKVNLKNKINESYEILIEHGLSKRLASQIVKDNFGNAYCIISDSNVAKFFGKKLLKQFRAKKAKAELLSFSPGEKNKNLRTVEMLLEKMLEREFDRKACVIALGGGISGDVAGFVASIYLRGVSYVHIPTTLLAMVDSSVGGKTGVDLSHGKNSAGTFCQPKKVYICPEFLDSLSRKELSNGLSEVVKHSVIGDKKFFVFLEKNIEKILKKDKKLLSKIIELNCKQKARIVEKDEKEGNYRRVVNYGHTIGHAIEILGNYKEFGHGEAISIGMVVEAQMSKELGFLKQNDVEKIRNLLERTGLPVKVPREKKISFKKILAATKKDKKRVSGKTYYSLPTKIGAMYSKKSFYGLAISDSDVLKALRKCL